MQVTIEVTQEHINQGECGNANSCAISQAMKAHLAKGVSVTTHSPIMSRDAEMCFWVQDHQELELNLGPTVYQFIKEFDQGKQRVQPFSMTLEIPTYLLKPETSVSDAGEKTQKTERELCLSV